MNQHLRIALILCLSLIITAIWLFSGLDRIPFHPDETSLLYQSRDLETWLLSPASLTWDEPNAQDPDQTYRLLNAPLPKYILGAGRVFAGFEALDVARDWDWTRSFASNQRRGAYPPINLLRGARAASTFLLLLGVAALFFAGLRLDGLWTAVIAMSILALHALALLHGRRAMAEGTLLFSISLLILGLIEARRMPWLTGIAIALAAASKLSAAAITPVALIAAIWPGPQEKLVQKSSLQRSLIFLAAAAGLYLALSPLLWSQPMGAIQAMWQERQSFLHEQVAITRARAPEQVLETPAQRLAAMLLHLYFQPVQFEEVGNYHQTLAPSIRTYQEPGRTLLRSTAGGSISLGLTIIGIGAGLLTIRRGESRERFQHTILLLAGGTQAAALLWANPLPYQRYYLPLLPFIILWQANGIVFLGRGMKKAASSLRRPCMRKFRTIPSDNQSAYADDLDGEAG